MSINPIWGHVAGVFIALMMISFIGIWIWAWRKYHKPTFNRMAHLPLEDEPETDVRTKEDRP
ncbi:cytochrome c oxidase cbb3-type subunit 4 [Rhodanobacter sp. TND4EL1]